MLAPKRKPPRSFKSKHYPPGGIPGVTTDRSETNRLLSQETTVPQNSMNNNYVELIDSRKQSVSITTTDEVFSETALKIRGFYN